MTINVTITKPGVTDQFGRAMTVGTTYAVEDNFGLSLISQLKASDTSSSLATPGITQDDALNVQYVNAAAIAAPTAQMLASYSTVFALNVAPFTRYQTNGSYLVPKAQYVTDSSNNIVGLANGQTTSIPLRVTYKPVAQVGFFGDGSNYSYTNPNASGATPTVVLPRTNTQFSTADVVIPAEVGDCIEYVFTGRINTDATNGLTLSVWSVAGTYRDLSSGTTGLSSVTGFLTIAAGATALQRVAVFYTVQASDIDANGMICLRLYGANSTGAVSATHTFVGAASNGTICQVIGMNHRKNLQNQYSITTQYPGGVKGSNLAFQTTGGAFGAISDVDPTGATDLVIPCTALDVIRIDLNGRYTAAVNLRWQIYVIKGGSRFRNVVTKGTAINVDGPWADTSSGTQSLTLFRAFRVNDTDMENGTVRIRLCVVATSGAGTQNHTLLGSDNVGGYTYWKANNMGSGWRYVITPTQSWEGGTSTATASMQEPAPWFDGSKYNLIYTAATANQLGWATALNPAGPWTKYASPIAGKGVLYAGNCARPSVFYENGIVYVYMNASNSRVDCAYGASPASLTVVTGGVTTGLPTNFSTYENTSVVKGQDGAYWMWMEGLDSVSTKWQIALAKSTSPTGPFTWVTGAQTSLQVVANGTVNGPCVDFGGTYYRMVHHATPNSSVTVPSICYIAISSDGQTWIRRGVDASGVATGIGLPFADINQTQFADPGLINLGTLNVGTLAIGSFVYMFATANRSNTTPEQGGIVVNDPLAWPININA